MKNELTLKQVGTKFLNNKLWCVYGPKSFPTLICCMVIPHIGYGPLLWGYSVWEYEPGFRTLGVNLFDWAKENDAHFFATQSDAIAVIRRLTSPKGI